MQIDLHGVKHEDVTRTVDKFIWECMQANVCSGTIITGNSHPMKQIVVSCLAEHGLTANNFFYNIGGKITFDLV
jgi:DNA-nicking Smr family endonuclease